MANVPPPAPAQPPPIPPPDAPPSVPLSWEGERMFNVYIYDYCFKRGYFNTARELMSEAKLPPDSAPPINARQGLLFEWWSVFWVLFTAKSNGTGPEEAMLYTQYQANQQLHRQTAQRLAAVTGQPLPLGQQPQPSMQQHQPQSSIGRLANGIGPRPGPGMAFTPNGPMANGVGPPGSMQPGGLGPFPMTPGGPTSNGIPGQHGPPPPPGAIPATQPPYQSLLHAQRPLGGALSQQQPQQPPQQQRPNNGPFQSPNMANSPQNPPGQQPPQHPQQQHHSHPPMGQLGGPSPHLAHMNRTGMLPPNQGPNSHQGLPGQNNAPTPGQYPQPGQPPSRTGTPGQGQGGMMNPSPSLAARQPPGASGQINPSDMNHQVMAIPQLAFQQIKIELGIQDKEINVLTATEKQRILGAWRTRQQKPGGPPDNAVAGPSNPMMQPPNPQQRNQQRNQPPQSQQLQQHQQQRAKRNSNSPGDDPDILPRTESSPPERKRLRRSPMESNAQSIPYPQGPPQQHPQPPGLPHSVMMANPSMMMGRGGPMMGMNGGQQHPGQPPSGGHMNLSGLGMSGGPQMGMQMGGGMHPHMGPPSTMTPHMHNQHMQAREAHFRGGPMSKQSAGMGGMMGGNVSSPASGDSFNLGGLGPGPGGGPVFNPGVGPNRMGPKTMMPPPSPGMNGAPKDQANTPGPGGQNGGKNPMSLESTRNPPLNTGPNAGQTPNGGGPPTPVPPTPQNQNPGGPGPGPQGLGAGGPTMAPSPSAMLGGPPPVGTSMGGQPSLTNPPGMPDNIFSSDFINSVASSLDEFDNSMAFRPDGDINFERDFGQWFNPDDAVSGLDAMK